MMIAKLLFLYMNQWRLVEANCNEALSRFGLVYYDKTGREIASNMNWKPPQIKYFLLRKLKKNTNGL